MAGGEMAASAIWRRLAMAAAGAGGIGGVAAAGANQLSENG